MTREVFIHNAKWFKTSLSTADMIGESNYEVAYLDEHMRRTVLKSDSRSTKLFDKDCIGRGVQLVEENRKTIHLAVQFPCTQEDIRMLYALSARIASLWNAASILVDDAEVPVSETDRWVEQDIAMNKRLLGEALNSGEDDVTLYCAMLPICIPVKQLQSYAEDDQAFSRYLHEKQKIGAYYSCPSLFSTDGAPVSFYVGIRNNAFILPYKPQMSFRKDGEEVQCDRAVVAIPYVFPDVKLGEMDYQTFVDRIPKEKLSEFDCRHMLVSSLSLEDLRAIYKG